MNALLLTLALAATQETPKGVRVEVLYDEHAVPHVFGETDEAALFGLGFQQVRDFPVATVDRMWRFSGRFSELVGPSYLDEDYRVRLWEVPAVVERSRRELEPDVRRLLAAYVRGLETGRAWWREGDRLQRLLGTHEDPANLVLFVDPLPDYLNQGFHPYQQQPGASGDVHPDYDPERVPAYVAAVLDRLFSTEFEVGLDNVLALGVAFNSGADMLYRASERRGVPQDEDGMTNTWLLSADATGGRVVTLHDNHTVRDSLTSRLYLVQVEGADYRAAGFTMPGFPCVELGFNRDLSWVGNGLARDGAVLRTAWEVTLEEGEGELVFPFGSAAGGSADGVSRMELQRVADRLRYFDPVASVAAGKPVVGEQPRTRYYAPESPELGLPNDRSPVTRARDLALEGLGVAPRPGDRIRFEQHSFTTAGHPWSFFLRLGAARSIGSVDGDAELEPGAGTVTAAIGDAPLSWANNLLVAEATSRFLHLYMAHVPVQGLGVRARLAPEEYSLVGTGALALDGSAADERWRGFHDWRELPRIGPVTVEGPEAWISCNVTFDHIETGDRFEAADLARFAPEIVRPTSHSNWRQVRAEELLRPESLAPGALAGRSEVVALDLGDTWMLRMWPFFRRAAELECADEADVTAFLAWVEAWRHLAPDGETLAPERYDFDAHPNSVVTVYTTLLHYTYANELLREAGCTPLQAGFGRDPLHPLLSAGPERFDRESHAPNLAAMVRALERIAALWKRGGGPRGLRNRELLVRDWKLEPWVSDPVLGATDDPHALRWGHAHVLALTPHFVPPGRAAVLGKRPVLARAPLFTAIAPGRLSALAETSGAALLERFDFPVYTRQRARVFPLGGVEDSLFPSWSQALWSRNGPSGWDQALYPWDAGHFYFAPHESGAQSLLLVTLDPETGPRARFLSGLGGTELTRAVEGGPDRFAPSADFARQHWNELELDRDALEADHRGRLELSYTPDDKR